MHCSMCKFSNFGLDGQEMACQILISCSKIQDTEERLLFATAMNVNELNNAITKYALTDDASDLIECGKQVRELLALLYID